MVNYRVCISLDVCQIQEEKSSREQWIERQQDNERTRGRDEKQVGGCGE